MEGAEGLEVVDRMRDRCGREKSAKCCDRGWGRGRLRRCCCVALKQTRGVWGGRKIGDASPSFAVGGRVISGGEGGAKLEKRPRFPPRFPPRLRRGCGRGFGRLEGLRVEV